MKDTVSKAKANQKKNFGKILTLDLHIAKFKINLTPYLYEYPSKLDVEEKKLISALQEWWENLVRLNKDVSRLFGAPVVRYYSTQGRLNSEKKLSYFDIQVLSPPKGKERTLPILLEKFGLDELETAYLRIIYPFALLKFTEPQFVPPQTVTALAQIVSLILVKMETITGNLGIIDIKIENHTILLNYNTKEYDYLSLFEIKFDDLLVHHNSFHNIEGMIKISLDSSQFLDTLDGQRLLFITSDSTFKKLISLCMEFQIELKLLTTKSSITELNLLNSNPSIIKNYGNKFRYLNSNHIDDKEWVQSIFIKKINRYLSKKFPRITKNFETNYYWLSINKLNNTDSTIFEIDWRSFSGALRKVDNKLEFIYKFKKVLGSNNSFGFYWKKFNTKPPYSKKGEKLPGTLFHGFNILEKDPITYLLNEIKIFNFGIKRSASNPETGQQLFSGGILLSSFDQLMVKMNVFSITSFTKSSFEDIKKLYGTIKEKNILTDVEKIIYERLTDFYSYNNQESIFKRIMRELLNDQDLKNSNLITGTEKKLNNLIRSINLRENFYFANFSFVGTNIYKKLKKVKKIEDFLELYSIVSIDLVTIELLVFLVSDINPDLLSAKINKKPLIKLLSSMCTKIGFFDDKASSNNLIRKMFGAGGRGLNYNKITVEEWFATEINGCFQFGSKIVKKTSILEYFRKQLESNENLNNNPSCGVVAFKITKDEINPERFGILLHIIKYFTTKKTKKRTIGHYLNDNMANLTREHLVILNLLENSNNLTEETEHISFNVLLKSLIDIDELREKYKDKSLDFILSRNWQDDSHKSYINRLIRISKQIKNNLLYSIIGAYVSPFEWNFKYFKYGYVNQYKIGKGRLTSYKEILGEFLRIKTFVAEMVGIWTKSLINKSTIRPKNMCDGIFEEFFHNELIGIEYKKSTKVGSTTGFLSAGQLLQIYYSSPTRLIFRISYNSKDYYISDLNIANNIEYLKLIHPDYSLINAINDYIAALFYGTKNFIQEKSISNSSHKFLIYKKEIENEGISFLNIQGKELSDSLNNYFPNRARGVMNLNWIDSNGIITNDPLNGKQKQRIHMIHYSNLDELLNRLIEVRSKILNISNKCQNIIGVDISLEDIYDSTSTQYTKLLLKIQKLVESHLKTSYYVEWIKIINQFKN